MLNEGELEGRSSLCEDQEEAREAKKSAFATAVLGEVEEIFPF